MNSASISISTLITTLEKPLLAYYESGHLAQQYAWWLLSAVTGKSKANLIAAQKVLLSSDDYHTLQHWLIDMTVHHKPIAYVLGSVPFADLNIMVEQPVLIPRPETEEWVLQLIEDLKPIAHLPLNILDMCTGSGCVALALAYAMPEAQIVGIDCSEQAIALAQENAQRYVLDNVTFLQSDLFTQIPENTTFDLIISNPPYISAVEWSFLDPSVTQWEDQAALLSEEEGYAHLFKIISSAPFYLKPNFDLQTLQLPNLVLEIGFNQGSAVAQFMKDQGAQRATVQQDLSGKDRVVKGHFYVEQDEQLFG